MRCANTVTSCAKVTLCLLNLWVLCVILVVALGHWRVFDADLSLNEFYDNSHLVVMRELKGEDNLSASAPIAPGAPVAPAAAAAPNAPVAPVAPAAPAAAPKSANTTSKGAKPGVAKDPVVLSPLQTEQAERVAAMKQWCRRLNPRTKDVAKLPADRLSMLLVDRKNKLLFCQIPGVAQNDWRRIFIYLTGQANVTSHLKISAYDAHSKYSKVLPKLSDFKPDERRQIVKESYKMLFVRDPFERLLTTYQNKFQARYSKYFHETFGRRIVQRYRKNATRQALKDGSDVRFGEFVRFVLDSEQEALGDGLLNEHWERYYRQCQPCALQYDFVGKFETLVQDTQEALKRARVLDRLKAPYVADTFRNSAAVLKASFKEVGAADLKRLWKMYYPDYNLFSYPYPDVLHQLLPKTSNDY